MTPKLGFITLILVLGGQSAAAQEAPSIKPSSTAQASASAPIAPEKQARIEEMLTLMGIKPRLDEANKFAQEDLRSYARRQVALLGEVPQDRKDELDRLSEAYVKELDAVAPRINWQGAGPLIILFCAEKYSDAEIEAIITFYKTPAGATLRANREPLEVVALTAVKDFQATIVPTTLQATERLIAQAEALRRGTLR